MVHASRSLIFGDFQFIMPTRELLGIGRNSSTPIPLGSRASEILHFFLQRRGELISKKEIMDAVWPGMAVEESNLTVQISALRRVLDESRNGGSCIQTVPGRGYRFILPVVEDDGAEAGRPDGAACAAITGTAEPMPDTPHQLAESVATITSPTNGSDRGATRNSRFAATIVSAVICVAMAVFAWQTWRSNQPDQLTQHTEPPRLSIVALPFVNATGEQQDDEVAAALTEDATTSLAQVTGAYVVARSMAQAIAARKLPLPAVGNELNVRYVLEGHIRHSRDGIELGVQLSDAASGASFWTRKFQGSATEPNDLRSHIAQDLRLPLKIAFIDAEASRIASLPEAALTAGDLLLKASTLENHLPITPAKNKEIIATLERALALEPRSPEIMISLARQTLLPIIQYGIMRDDERMLRAQSLADRARALVAGSEPMRDLQAQILRAQRRYDEAYAAYSSLMQSSIRYHSAAAWCLIYLGRSAEAVPVLQEAIKLDRGETLRYSLYFALGAALIRLGRDEEAINWLRAAKEHSSGSIPPINRALAIAYANSGKIEDARREVQQYIRMRPFWTARRQRHLVQPTLAADAEHAREVDGLVKAGLPDSVSEDFDPGLPITTGVQSRILNGATPAGAPGVSIVKTSELRTLIGGAGDDMPPLVLSTDCSDCFNIAFPGAIFVPDALRSGVLDDEGRRALKIFVDRLLGADRTRRLITMSWSMGFWEARNIAIELVALGYPNVSWYRGGLEAWDVAGLPVTQLK